MDQRALDADSCIQLWRSGHLFDREYYRFEVQPQDDFDTFGPIRENAETQHLKLAERFRMRVTQQFHPVKYFGDWMLKRFWHTTRGDYSGNGTRQSVRIRIVRLAVVFFVLIAVFVLLLTAVFALPQGPILENLQVSLPQLQSEGLAPRPIAESDFYQLDNFTDALMLDTSIAEPTENALRRAVAMRNGLSLAPGATPIAALAHSLDGRERVTEPYAYYWHGYQLVLRPLLLVFRYSDIRLLNLMCLSAVMFALCLFMRDTTGVAATTSYFLSLLLVGFYVAPASMQFSSVLYVMLLSTFAVALSIRRRRLLGQDIEIFFFAGMVTVFLDLLTAPLLTLGIPLAVAIIMLGRSDSQRTLRDDLSLVIRTSVAWATGYGLTWVSKAIIATAVLGSNVIESALGSFVLRSGIEAKGSLITTALRRNLLGLFPMYRINADATTFDHVMGMLLFVGIVAVFALALLWIVFSNRKPAVDIKRNARALLVVPLPYLWFAVMSNHSAVHYWFSYRIQAIALFPILFFVASSLDSSRLRARILRLGQRIALPAKSDTLAP